MIPALPTAVRAARPSLHVGPEPELEPKAQAQAQHNLRLMLARDPKPAMLKPNTWVNPKPL